MTRQVSRVSACLQQQRHWLPLRRKPRSRRRWRCCVVRLKRRKRSKPHGIDSAPLTHEEISLRKERRILASHSFLLLGMASSRCPTTCRTIWHPGVRKALCCLYAYLLAHGEKEGATTLPRTRRKAR